MHVNKNSLLWLENNKLLMYHNPTPFGIINSIYSIKRTINFVLDLVVNEFNF